MNRTEALRTLGLDEDATPEDIKTAYRETAQILHPDRFAGNKKLQERATEQFKTLQDAYSSLMGKGGSASRERGASRASSGLTEERELEARLAGIAAACVQLAAQRDTLGDERRNGTAFLVIGGIVALICGRRPTGLFLGVTALASAVAVWGAVQLISAQRGIATIDARMKELADEKKRIVARLDEL